MSKTFRREKSSVRDRHLKLDDRYTGHVGEGVRSDDAVRRLKRAEHKHNRRIRNQLPEEELL